ncbi:hypothetical protein V2J09_002148, partial [Rumex salicifolius]
ESGKKEPSPDSRVSNGGAAKYTERHYTGSPLKRFFQLSLSLSNQSTSGKMEEKRRESSFFSAAGDSGFGEGSFAGESTITRRRGGGLKRKASGSSASPSSLQPSKRAHRDKANVSLSMHQIHNGPLTRARQLSDSAATSMTLASEKNENLQAAQAPRQETEEMCAARKVFEALEAAVESEVEAIRSRDDNAHVVPVPAGWFSWTSIHPIEKHFLPLFFNGKSENKSPEIYLEIRNWIMNKFHTNPSANIELKDLSELSVGELEARKEIMEFLDCWGLINYHPFPPKDFDNTTAADSTNDDNAEKMDTGSLIEKLYRFETEQPYLLPIPAANTSAPATVAGLLHESAIAEELGKQEGPSVEYHCNSCSADCSRKRYHCQKQADFDLCSECYNNGKFGSDMSPSDFILMEFAEVSSASGGRWTDQETLLLLEALELFKENWNEIAEHVATKTKAQCILHFLQMPIEDNFLDFDDETKDSAPGNPKLNPNPDTTMSDISDDPKSAEAEAGADKGSTKNESSIPKDASETSENIIGSVENEPTLTPTETSKAEVAPNAKISKEVCNEFAVKALKETFQTVGCLLNPEEKLSFAEAGNPVMSLTTFLSRLVDPGVTSASVCSSLKSIDSKSPDMQFALRHCFLLEDPPEGDKEQIGSGSAAAMEVDHDNKEEKRKKEDKGEMKQTEEDIPTRDENSTPVVDPKTPLEKKDESSEKSNTTEKSDENAGDELVKMKIANDSMTSDLLKDQAADATKDSSAILASSLEPSPVCGQQVEAISAVESVKSKEASEDVNMESNSVDPVKKQESDPRVSTVEGEAKTGDDKTNDGKPEFQKATETKDDHNVDKLKRAAVTTLAAAAVKAKLLANQEEDEIKHIAALMIEKQLRKLEVKMSFFSDMDNAILRVKEQLDRSKQMLYHERAQIIAARFGIPPSSASRPLMSMLPVGRGAVGPGSRMMRPPMNTAPLRPPMTRPMMTSGPVTSVAAVASTVTGGSSMRPSSQ